MYLIQYRLAKHACRKDTIYLNGAILGMKKLEIKRKFDEIVAFAEIEKFLDTPVKHYSSGMYVRLAFAVAAHLQPEILLVDEVLAVGDAAFQKKCLGKMGEVAQQGRTVLFVSHNMAAIGQLCERVFLIEKGNIEFDGDPGRGIECYLNTTIKAPPARSNGLTEDESKDAQIISAHTRNESGIPRTIFRHDESPILEIEYIVRRKIPNLKLDVRVCDRMERRIFTSSTECVTDDDAAEGTVDPRRYRAAMHIPSYLLTPNHYHFLICLHIPASRVLDKLELAAPFEIVDFGSKMAQYSGQDYGCIFANCTWQFARIAKQGPK